MKFENKKYRETLPKNKEKYNFKDFENACNALNLPIFEHLYCTHYYRYDYIDLIENKVYHNFEDFKKSMPEFTEEYDVENIETGFFKIYISDFNYDYEWSFLVTDTAVLVDTFIGIN